MPRATVKRLVNTAARATVHHCVRLEIRGHGPKKGIYAVFRCVATGSERDFGYISWRTKEDELRHMYPGVELIDTTEAA